MLSKATCLYSALHDGHIWLVATREREVAVQSIFCSKLQIINFNRGKIKRKSIYHISHKLNFHMTDEKTLSSCAWCSYTVDSLGSDPVWEYSRARNNLFYLLI